MSQCVKPLRAYWRNAARDGVTFDINKSATKIPFKLPCGRCIGCRLKKAEQWGIRCLHEAKLWPQNSFVTLTYNDDCLPPGGSLVVRDMQLFMKRLRKWREPEKLRFFCGGEYGEENKRPHYHLLLFNCGFPNLKRQGENARGEILYTSSVLTELWPYGFHTIGAVTFDSAVYCAKYALKKVNGDFAKAHYEVYDADGLVFDRLPEFAIMSRRPGIGHGYYAKYGSEVRAHDSIIVDGRECPPPRYYDSKSESVDPVRFDLIKKRRKRLGVLARFDNTDERLRVKERLLEIAAEQKERKL